MTNLKHLVGTALKKNPHLTIGVYHGLELFDEGFDVVILAFKPNKSYSFNF